MPTTRPRYQVTDTGRVRGMLDRAAAAWPHLAGDRKALLLRLAEAGVRELGEPAGADLDSELEANAGRWVALRDGRLLVAHDDPAEVVAWLREREERAETLFRVPLPGEELATEHGLA